MLALFVLHWIIPDSLIFKPLRLLLAKNDDEMSKRSIQGKRFSSGLILIVQSVVRETCSIVPNYGTVKRAEKTCNLFKFASLLQNEFNSDVACFIPTNQTCLDTNHAVTGCEKLF